MPNKILVIEDDPDDQLLIADAFDNNKQACELIFAANGKHAIELLSANLPCVQLILLDLNMPVMNGFELLAHFQNNRVYGQIPVVVLTTSSEMSSVKKSYELGAISYIVKPQTFPQLQALTAELVKYWFQTVKLPSDQQTG